MNEEAKALLKPFDPYYVKWKAQSTRGDSALAVAYIDARAVMDRLDEVIGPGNWSDDYLITDLGIICNLRIRDEHGEWVGKQDIGQTDGSGFTDPGKTGFSDAFKRAAVKWGIGRYLYRIPAKWVGYDSQHKRLTEIPSLPDWALPRSNKKPDVGYQEPEEQTENIPLKPRDDQPTQTKQKIGKDPTELIAKGKEAMTQGQDADIEMPDFSKWRDTEWTRFYSLARLNLQFKSDRHAENTVKQIFEQWESAGMPAYALAWEQLIDHQREAGRL